MRRTAIAALLVGGLLVTACGDDDTETADTPVDGTESAGTEPAGTEPAGTAAAADGDCAAGLTITDGTLTVATGEPAFEPWVVGDAPETGEGFEAAVAYAVASEMGFTAEQVTWVRTTFDEAIQPGAKNFDFNLQQYSITPERSESISFSDPYYSTIRRSSPFAGSPAEGASTVADLKDVKFGAQAGTTSLAFVVDVIQPTPNRSCTTTTSAPRPHWRPTRSTRSSSTYRPRSSSRPSRSRAAALSASSPRQPAAQPTTSGWCSASTIRSSTAPTPR